MASFLYKLRASATRDHIVMPLTLPPTTSGSATAFDAVNANEILPGQVSIGNLSAATCVEQRDQLGITHILSVCPEYVSTGPQHLTIPVNDTECDDLLIHLPKACQFIQNALDHGGKVLVHCVMGISRSTTVVAAYIMKTRKVTASAAIRLIKQRRPQVHPNYGFIKQLAAFAECHYEPSPTNAAYVTWKKKQVQNVTFFLNHMIDTTPIIPDQLLLSSDFPKDHEQAQSLVFELGITHILSISPAQISTVALQSMIKHHHINISNHSRESLLLALPDTGKYIQEAISSGGHVLVHCLVESRACIVVCAYLMASRGIGTTKAYAILEHALPLFNPTRKFLRHLELFEACGFRPTSEHPLVKEWVAADKGSDSFGVHRRSTSATHAE